MKRVSIVFTEHQENGSISAAELVAILERTRPEVIFIECPPQASDRYFSDRGPTLESTAVSRYREMRPVDVVPVDLPTPDVEFFIRMHDLIERVARTGPDYDRLASRHRQYARDYGFAYLNSEHCSDLFAKRHEVCLAALSKLADHDLAAYYDSWVQTNKDRDSAMLTNIESHCRHATFGRGVFLVGAGHRQSILDLLIRDHGTASSSIQWDFSGLLEHASEASTRAGAL